MKSITGAKVKLTGSDGNAFAIMGKAKEAMKKAGISNDVIKKYIEEATSGDYDHLLQTTMKYVEVS